MRNRNKDNALDELLNKLFNTPNDDIRNKRKAYHIMIVENDTGNVIADTDTNCIVGAFDEGDGTRQVGISKCNIVELIGSCTGAKAAVEKMTANNPLAKLMLTMAKTME